MGVDIASAGEIRPIRGRYAKEEEMEEESGIKWGAVFAVIKKRLIFIIAIAVVAALVAGLLTGFVFNAGKDTYTLSFDLKSPSGEGSLPDGTAFSVQNLVYSGNLQRVKDSNEMFAGLDIGILSSGDITITDNNRAVEGEEKRPAADARYTITAKESCFDSYEQADEFMHAVAESFVTLTQEALNGRNYSAWEQSYTLAPDYDERINVLRSQYNYVLSVYDGLIATRAYADFEVDGYTVEQHRAQAAGDISTRLTALGNEQNISAYVLGDSNNAVLYEAKELERQKQVNTAKIDALRQTLAELLQTYKDAGLSTSQMDTFESFHADIASLTQRNVEIDEQLERLYTSIGYVEQEGKWVMETGQLSKAPQTFTDEMEALRTRIAADTQTMSKVVSAVYSGFTAAEFRQAGAEVTSGGTNTIFVTVAVFVVAAFAAACVFALAGYRKQVSAEEAAQSEVKAADGGAEEQTADETEAAEQTDGSAESGEEKGEDK